MSVKEISVQAQHAHSLCLSAPAELCLLDGRRLIVIPCRSKIGASDHHQGLQELEGQVPACSGQSSALRQSPRGQPIFHDHCKVRGNGLQQTCTHLRFSTSARWQKWRFCIWTWCTSSVSACQSWSKSCSTKLPQKLPPIGLLYLAVITGLNSVSPVRHELNLQFTACDLQSIATTYGDICHSQQAVNKSQSPDIQCYVLLMLEHSSRGLQDSRQSNGRCREVAGSGMLFDSQQPAS